MISWLQIDTSSIYFSKRNEWHKIGNSSFHVAHLDDDEKFAVFLILHFAIFRLKIRRKSDLNIKPRIIDFRATYKEFERFNRSIKCFNCWWDLFSDHLNNSNLWVK